METPQHSTAIVIVTFNNANLICKQVDCIKKFCKDDFDIIIVDNSNKQDVIDAIQYYNNTQLHCTYYKTWAKTLDASGSHAFACGTGYSKIQNQYKYILLLDHDNFPIQYFSVKEILKDKVMAGLGQGNPNTKTYFWPGCVCWDNTKVEHNLIDFSPDTNFKIDTGGNLWKVINKYGKENCVFFNEAYHQNPHFAKSFYNFYAMINDGMFMHFINGSNWANANDDEERINALLNILEEKKIENLYQTAVIIYHRNVYERYEKEWVDACIQSIRNQTYKHFMVYELNYGEDKMQLYEGSVFEQKPMRNFIVAMNYLLDKVFAAWHKVCFNINIDDNYALERFALQIAEVEKGAELVSSDFQRIGNGNISSDYIFHDKNITEEFAKNPPHNILCHPVICYTPQFWQKYGPYNPDSVKYEDMELWQKAVKGGARIHIVPKILVSQRIHDKNVGTMGEEHEDA